MKQSVGKVSKIYFRILLSCLLPAVLLTFLFEPSALQLISMLFLALVAPALASRYLAEHFAAPQMAGENTERNSSYTKEILRAALDGIITVNDRDQVIEFTPAAEDIFGYTEAEAKQQSLTDLIIPHHLRETHSNAFQRFVATGEKHIIGKRIEVPALRKNGEIFPVEMTLTSVRQNGELYITAFLRDLSEKKETEEQLQIAYSVFTTAREGIMVTNSSNEIKAVNPAFTSITGFQEHEVLGKNPSVLSSGHHDAAFYKGLWKRLLAKGTWQGEVWNRRKNGDIYPQQLSISVVKDAKGNITDHVATLTDITQRKETEERILHQATHDPLTGLPNRPLFFDRLSQAIASHEREHQILSVMFVDLDRFKNINDKYGHLLGDKLLREVSHRLSHALRASDTVVRLGGDEFAIILPMTDDNGVSSNIAKKLIRKVTAPYHIDEKKLDIGCSIGLADYPTDGQTPSELIAAADSAMYQAKTLGGNSFFRYSEATTAAN